MLQLKSDSVVYLNRNSVLTPISALLAAFANNPLLISNRLRTAQFQPQKSHSPRPAQ
jgi:hypothetical protein